MTEFIFACSFDGDMLIVSNILIIILSRELINISKDDITSRSARTKRMREREEKAKLFFAEIAGK
jgi:hypothetical protein